MADILSATPGVRTIRRVTSSFRLWSPHSKLREEVVPAPATEISETEPMVRVCLEVHEDKSSGEVVYRLINVETGAVIQEWRGDQIHELRDILRQNHIQFLDKKV